MEDGEASSSTAPREAASRIPLYVEWTAINFHRCTRRESVTQFVEFTNDDHGHERREHPVFGGRKALLVFVEKEKSIGMLYKQKSVACARRRCPNDEKKARDEKRGPSPSDESCQCSGASRHLLIVDSWDATPYRSMLVLSNCELKYASEGTEKSHAPSPRLCSS
jgi:hypothetical protein